MIDSMDKAAKVFFFLALAGLYLWGSYASLHAGLTWDEQPEFFVLLTNALAVQGLLHGDLGPYRALVEYNDRYYGIGFDFPAHFVQILIEKPVAGHFGLEQSDAYMLSKHWVIFSLFFGCGFVVRNLVHQFTRDALFSTLAMIGFLLWPYVFGHAMFNIKDVPFMCAWLLCTGYSFSLARRHSEGQVIGRWAVCLLAMLTGWLISIRVAGILIFLQYALTIFFLRGAGSGTGSTPHPLRTGNLALFAVCLILFVYVAYPLFWLHPLEAFAAVVHMGHHPHGLMDSCTRTFGLCIKGVPPASYIPMWLSVKLPVMVLVGCLLLPLALLKLPPRKDEVGVRLFWVMVSVSLLIPVSLIVGHAVLYNEIRQILFLMPFIYCAGVVSLYLISRKIAIASLLVSIGISMADHALAFPYQYIWFNEIARQYPVEKYFETDYWCGSGRGLARQLTAAIREVEPVNCIYADPDAQIKPFMGTQFTGCFQNIHKLTPESPKPYLTTSYPMTEVVVDCPVIRQEKFRLFLGKGDITVGWVRYCK